MEKLLIECTLELFAAGLVAGIQDLGGAGLSCATSELASAGDGGMHVELDRVPLRDSSLAPEEILMSESQERMMAVVEPADVDGVPRDLREVGGRRHRRSARSPTATGCRSTGTASASSTYRRARWPTTARRTTGPFARPDSQDALQADAAERLPRPTTGEELRATLLRLVASPNLCDKSWITDQYDRYVQGNTVLAQPSDSGMIRVDDRTNLGVAVSTDCNGRFARLDPYAGAQLALAESYRNVSTGGATPMAISDCLNFGSPEDPAVMWQFAEACRGLKDACVELGIPVTGGNVSLYNQTGETAILPTPVVAVLGVIEDVTRRTPDRLPGRGTPGAAARRDPRGAVRARSGRTSSHGHLGGTAAPGRPRGRARPQRAARRRRPACSPRPTTSPTAASRRPWSSRACATGSAPGSSSSGDPFVALFSESAGRVLVTVAPEDEERLFELAAEHGVPITSLGETRGDLLSVTGLFDVPLEELRTAWTPTLPAALG